MTGARGALLERGAAAAEEVAGKLLRVDVSKALNPLRRRDYLVIVERVARRIETAVGPAEKSAVAAALDELDVSWERMRPSQVDAVVSAANLALRRRAEKIAPKVEAVLAVEGPKLAAATRAAMRSAHKLEIAADLSARDKLAEKLVRKSTANFVRNEMGRRVAGISERARSIVARGMETGLGTRQIAEDLRRGLGDRVSRDPSYWRVIASSFSGHARTFSQVTSLDDAGIEAWMFEAVLDEATSAVCRLYHGKTWSTETAVSHVEKILDVQDPEEIVEVSPWVRTGRDRSGNEFLYVPQGEQKVRIATVVRDGVGRRDDVGEFRRVRSADSLAQLGAILPPLHGLCRSMIVPA